MTIPTPKPVRLAYKKKMRIGSVDLDTGEILNDGVIVQRPVKIKHFTQDYMIMFLQIFERIAKDDSIKLDEYRVLNLLVSRTQMKNWVQLQQKEIAEELGMKVPNVSRALKKLQEKHLVESTTKLGRAKSYRVSIDVGWRGTGKSYTDEKTLRLVNGIKEASEKRGKPS